MSDLGDSFRQQKKEQQERRALRLPNRVDEIMTLKKVVKLSEYQFRVDGWIDLYPIHRRFHHLGKNKRGDYFIKDGLIYNRQNKLIISKF